MTSLSKNKRRWNEIDATAAFFSVPALREFYAGAAKHLIPAEGWADTHPHTPLDSHLIVVAMHTGFDKWTKTDIAQALDKSDGQLRLIKLAANSDGRKMSLRRAKKYLTDLRKQLARRLRARSSEQEFRPERGLAFYDRTLKRKYFARSGIAPNSDSEPTMSEIS